LWWWGLVVLPSGSASVLTGRNAVVTLECTDEGRVGGIADDCGQLADGKASGKEERLALPISTTIGILKLSAPKPWRA